MDRTSKRIISVGYTSKKSKLCWPSVMLTVKWFLFFLIRGSICSEKVQVSSKYYRNISYRFWSLIHVRGLLWARQWTFGFHKLLASYVFYTILLRLSYQEEECIQNHAVLVWGLQGRQATFRKKYFTKVKVNWK